MDPTYKLQSIFFEENTHLETVKENPDFYYDPKLFEKDAREPRSKKDLIGFFELSRNKQTNPATLSNSKKQTSKMFQESNTDYQTPDKAKKRKITPSRINGRTPILPKNSSNVISSVNPHDAVRQHTQAFLPSINHCEEQNYNTPPDECFEIPQNTEFFTHSEHQVTLQTLKLFQNNHSFQETLQPLNGQVQHTPPVSINQDQYFYQNSYYIQCLPKPFNHTQYLNVDTTTSAGLAYTSLDDSESSHQKLT